MNERPLPEVGIVPESEVWKERYVELTFWRNRSKTHSNSEQLTREEAAVLRDALTKILEQP